MAHQPARSPRLVGTTAALTTTLAWGGQFIVGASAMHHIDAVWLTAARYASAALVLVAVLAVVEGGPALRPERRWQRAAVLGSVGFGGFNLLMYGALTDIGPQAAALLVSTMPLATAFVMWARTGHRPPVVTWTCGVVALFGVALVLTSGDLRSLVDGGLSWGHLMAVTGVVCWVVYTTGAASVTGWSPLRYTTISAVFGSVFIVAIAAGLSAAGRLDVPTAATLGAIWWQLAYLSLLGAVVAVLTWNVAVKSLGALDAVLFINIVPVTTFVVEAVLGRPPAPVQVVGATITMGAIVANNVLVRRRDLLARRTPAVEPVTERVPANA